MNKCDFWLTDEVWRVVQFKIARDMAKIEDYYRDIHLKNPDRWILEYWQKIALAYWVVEAEKRYLREVRRIFDKSKK